MNQHQSTLLLTIAAAFAAHSIVSIVYGQPAKTSPVSTSEVELIKPEKQDGKSGCADIRVPSFHSKSGNRPHLDLAFCIDTTSSMQGEIDTVKAKVKSMVAKISSGKDKPIVRVGLVAYRDLSDEYVTKVFPFSEDIDKVVKDISDLEANGGGDGPEAVDQGIHVALNQLSWNDDKHAAKLLYVIGDAPSHFNPNDYDLGAEAKFANSRGISINTIGCDGLESYGNDGTNEFRKIANLTNGSFQSLSYHSQVIDSTGHVATLVTAGGKTFEVKSKEKDAWRSGADTLVASGSAAPMLQGATNGTIGPQGGDATVICGVNTAGTVRVDNNLEDIMLKGAQDAFSKIGK